MLKKSPEGYYFFERFKQQLGLIHGFSTRQFGDCNPAKTSNRQNVEKFLATLELKRKNLVTMEQVHGNRIKVVDEEDRGKIIPDVDGLVTEAKKVVLGVKMADCLPILSYDPVRKIIGAAHAGWRGVLKKIPQKMVEVMIKLGSLPEDIIVGIGPHIGSCCYCIDVQRAEGFKKEFGELKRMINNQKNKIYLDLAVPTIIQLLHTGIFRKNIELSSLCTACQNKEFFSYRKDSKKTYGKMLGVISSLPERQ